MSLEGYVEVEKQKEVRADSRELERLDLLCIRRRRQRAGIEHGV